MNQVQGSSGHSGGEAPTHEVAIIVNGRQKLVSKGELTFEEVIALAYDTLPPGASFDFSVTYMRGHDDRPQGTLERGESVRVKKDMKFDVTATNRS